VRIFGDADADGIPSDITVEYQRKAGVYQLVSPTDDDLAMTLSSYPF
jgi:hypothetical protein